MDANKIFETKQEAATTADLLQQEPHAEVVDLMSCVASSDERLAAGLLFMYAPLWFGIHKGLIRHVI